MRKIKTNLAKNQEINELKILLSEIERTFEESANNANALEDKLALLNDNLCMLANKERIIRERMRSLKNFEL